MPTYCYSIYDNKMKEVQTVHADTTNIEGTMVMFLVDDVPELIYNLPPGYSITAEVAEA